RAPEEARRDQDHAAGHGGHPRGGDALPARGGGGLAHPPSARRRRPRRRHAGRRPLPGDGGPGGRGPGRGPWARGGAAHPGGGRAGRVGGARAAARAAGAIPRVLNPQTVSLTRRFRGDLSPTVLDFGVSKLVAAGDVNLTATSAIVGTASYMSPEQAVGAKL